MYYYFHTKIKKSLGANFVAILVTLLSFNLAVPPAYAQVISNLPLPEPGQLVEFSKPYQPVVLRAITINQKDPLLFDFIVERGDSTLEGEALDREIQKLVKYFLTALTMKDDEVWVNLSPYEKDQMIPSAFGVTEMGKDLLVEDYMLKQITASLTHPDSEVGKKFWQKVYDKAYKLYGTTQIPINTFSKVWVLPDKSVVLEKEGSAFVVESHLKVMLEEDYLAIKKNLNNREIGTDRLDQAKVEYINSLSAEIVKEIVLPELEKEVNTGENFALARQVYNSAVLAAWYKKRLRETLLGKLYIDQNKVAGVDADDLDSGEKVYDQYMEALRAGVYNMVKQDYDLASQSTVQRRYFSGGFKAGAAVTESLKNNTIEVRPGYLDTLSVSQRQTVEAVTQTINTPGQRNFIKASVAVNKVTLEKSGEIGNIIIGKKTDGPAVLRSIVGGQVTRGDFASLSRAETIPVVAYNYLTQNMSLLEADVFLTSQGISEESKKPLLNALQQRQAQIRENPLLASEPFHGVDTEVAAVFVQNPDLTRALGDLARSTMPEPQETKALRGFGKVNPDRLGDLLKDVGPEVAPQARAGLERVHKAIQDSGTGTQPLRMMTTEDISLVVRAIQESPKFRTGLESEAGNINAEQTYPILALRTFMNGTDQEAETMLDNVPADQKPLMRAERQRWQTMVNSNPSLKAQVLPMAQTGRIAGKVLTERPEIGAELAKEQKPGVNEAMRNQVKAATVLSGMMQPEIDDKAMNELMPRLKAVGINVNEAALNAERQQVAAARTSNPNLANQPISIGAIAPRSAEFAYAVATNPRALEIMETHITSALRPAAVVDLAALGQRAETRPVTMSDGRIVQVSNEIEEPVAQAIYANISQSSKESVANLVTRDISIPVLERETRTLTVTPSIVANPSAMTRTEPIELTKVPAIATKASTVDFASLSQVGGSELGHIARLGEVAALVEVLRVSDPVFADGKQARAGAEALVALAKNRDRWNASGIEGNKTISPEIIAVQLQEMRVEPKLITPLANAIPKLAARYGDKAIANIQGGSRINLGDLSRTFAMKPATINGTAVQVSQNISDDNVRRLSAVVLPSLPSGVQADLSRTLKSVVLSSSPDATPVFDTATGKLVVPAKVFEQPAAIRDLVQVNSQRSEPGVKPEINISDYGFSRAVSGRVVKMDDGRGVEVAAGISDQVAKTVYNGLTPGQKLDVDRVTKAPAGAATVRDQDTRTLALSDGLEQNPSAIRNIDVVSVDSKTRINVEFGLTEFTRMARSGDARGIADVLKTSGNTAFAEPAKAASFAQKVVDVAKANPGTLSDLSALRSALEKSDPSLNKAVVAAGTSNDVMLVASRQGVERLQPAISPSVDFAALSRVGGNELGHSARLGEVASIMEGLKAVDPAFADDRKARTAADAIVSLAKNRTNWDALGIESKKDINPEILALRLQEMGVDAQLVAPLANAIPKLVAREGTKAIANIQSGSRINLGDLSRTFAMKPATINGTAVQVSQNISDDNVRRLSAVVLPSLPSGVQADLSRTLKSVVLSSSPDATPVFDTATGKLVVPAKVFEQSDAIRDLVRVNSQRSETGVKPEINISDYGFSRQVSNGRVVTMDDGRGVEVAGGISDQAAKTVYNGLPAGQKQDVDKMTKAPAGAATLRDKDTRTLALSDRVQQTPSEISKIDVVSVDSKTRINAEFGLTEFNRMAKSGDVQGIAGVLRTSGAQAFAEPAKATSFAQKVVEVAKANPGTLLDLSALRVALEKDSSLNKEVVAAGTSNEIMLTASKQGVERIQPAKASTVDFAALGQKVETRPVIMNDGRTIAVSTDLDDKTARDIYTNISPAARKEIKSLVSRDVAAPVMIKETGEMAVTSIIAKTPSAMKGVEPIELARLPAAMTSSPVTIDDVVRLVEDRSRRGEDKENPINISEFRQQLELVAKAPDILTVENQEKLRQVAPIVDHLLTRSDFRAELAKLSGVASVPERTSSLVKTIASANLNAQQWDTYLKNTGYSGTEQQRTQLAKGFEVISKSPEVRARIEKGDITVLRAALVDPGGVAPDVANRLRETDVRKLGGIDLSAERMDLKIERDGDGVPLPVQMQDIQNIRIEGLYPVIMNVAPATPESLPFLSSSLDDAQQQALTDSKVN